MLFVSSNCRLISHVVGKLLLHGHTELKAQGVIVKSFQYAKRRREGLLPYSISSHDRKTFLVLPK